MRLLAVSDTYCAALLMVDVTESVRFVEPVEDIVQCISR